MGYVLWVSGLMYVNVSNLRTVWVEIAADKKSSVGLCVEIAALWNILLYIHGYR